MLTPENGARNVTDNELIMIHATPDAAFDSTGELTIFESNGRVFKKIAFNSSDVVDLSRTRAIIDPRKKFKIGSQYAIQFKSNNSSKNVALKSTDWQFQVGVQLEEQIYSSKMAKTDYRLLIMLPKAYRQGNQKTFPVVYVTDGGFFNRNQYAQIADAMAKGSIPDVIVVGIAYPKVHGINAVRKFRARDMCGGAHGHFSEFLSKELLPYINKNYRTRPEENTLMGNSCGGTFAAAVFFERVESEEALFKNYISIAPDYTLSEQEKKFNRRFSQFPVNFYLSIGDRDLPDRIAGFNSLSSVLAGIKDKNFRFEKRVIQGAVHGEVSSTPGFKEALTLLLRD